VIGSLERKVEQQESSEEEEVAQVAVKKEEEIETSCNEEASAGHEVSKVEEQESSEEEEVVQVAVKEEEIETSSHKEVSAEDKVPSRQQNAERHQTQKRDATLPVQEGRTAEEELNHFSSADDLMPSNDGTEDDANGNAVVRPIIPTAEVAKGRKRTYARTSSSAEIKEEEEEESAASPARQSRYADYDSEDTEDDQEDIRRDESYSDGSDEGSNNEEFGWQNRGNNFELHKYGVDRRMEENYDLETDERQRNNANHEIHQYGNRSDDLQIHEEEQLNSAPIDNDDLVQPTNDVTGDDGHGSRVLAASTTEIPTSEVLGGKKRSREAASSTLNVTVQARSTKRAKLPYSTSTLYDTSEETGTTSQPCEVRSSARRATTKAHEATFEGTSRGIEAEEEVDDDCMPVVEEDRPPAGDGDGDYRDEDYKGIVAKRAQQGCTKSFDGRFKALMGFKEKFGHCNVPQKGTSEYQSLGKWCDNLRTAYKRIQKGEIPRHKLAVEQIQQLNDAGFKWILSTCRTFDERYAELMKFKKKVGHCNAPQKTTGEYKSLGNWCRDLRTAYKKILMGKTPAIKLTRENMKQLENAGFKWSLATLRTFDERFAELMKFKEKVGHCDVMLKRTGEYQSLGNWCHNLRSSYKKIQKRETPLYKLTEENIQKLEDAGFKWSLVLSP